MLANEEGDADLVAAWARLEARYKPLLLRASSSRLRAVGVPQGDAEEVVQGLLARLALPGTRSLAAWDARASLGTWLAAVALREASDHARRERRHAAVPEPAPQELPSPLGVLIEAEDRQRLGRALANLSGRTRLLLRLMHVEGFSYREAAGILGVAEASISPLLQRALASLKSEYARTDPGSRGVSR